MRRKKTITYSKGATKTKITIEIVYAVGVTRKMSAEQTDTLASEIVRTINSLHDIPLPAFKFK